MTFDGHHPCLDAFALSALTNVAMSRVMPQLPIAGMQ
jgi:hypothetical protein